MNSSKMGSDIRSRISTQAQDTAWFDNKQLFTFDTTNTKPMQKTVQSFAKIQPVCSMC